MTGTMDDSTSGGRFLVTSVVTSYAKAPDLDVPELRDAQAAMVTLFRDRFGYQTHDLGVDLDARDLKSALRDFATQPERHPDDYVVVYLAGHGELVDLEDNVREYRFLAADAKPEDLAGTGVKVDDIADWLLTMTMIRRLILILDTCYAGDAAIDLLRHPPNWRLGADRLAVGAGGALIASALPRTEAYPAQFTAAFVAAATSPAVAGNGQPTVGIDSIINELKIDAIAGRPQQIGYLPVFGDVASLAFFPNPDRHPELIDETLEEASYQVRRRLEVAEDADRRDWFLPRAANDFIGRRSALTDLATWLNSGADTRSRIVVGGPGAGKTSLIGLCASLSDRRFRGSIPTGGFDGATLPDVGSIDGIVYAGRRTSADVLARMALTAGVEDVDDSPEAMSLTLRRTLRAGAARVDGRPLTLVVDALDEADDPVGLVNDVIRPLTEQGRGHLRFLLGCRPKVPQLALGDDWMDRHARTFVGLDLDGEYADDVSLKQVVRRILLEGPRPAPGAAPEGSVLSVLDTESLQIAIDTIADIAQRSFYFATLIAGNEARRSAVPDVRSSSWRQELPKNTGDAMRADLERHFRDRVELAFQRLRPLAYARGTGMPWEDIWPALVRALEPGTDCSTIDLIELVDNAGSYVVEGAPVGGRSTYRLFHQSLVEVLQQERDPVADEAAISRTLQHLTPRRLDGRVDWPRAHPYTRTFLPLHAARAGRLPELVQDPGLLLAAVPGSMMSAIDTLPNYPPRPLNDVEGFLRARLAADAYMRAANTMRREPPARAASSLALAARCGSADELADRIIADGLATEWMPRWAHWRRPDASRLVATHDAPVWAVAVAELAGRPVVVSGSGDRSVRVWDLATGAPVGAPFTGHDGPVWAVAVAEVEGRPVVVSGSDDRSVRVWDLATGAPVGAPLTGHDGPVWAVAVAEVEGRPVVVSGSGDRSVRVWDLATGAPVGAPLTGHDGRVWAVAVAEVEGRPVVVSGSDDRSVRVWDLATGAPVGAPFTGHDGPVVAVAVAEVAGRPVVVSGSGDRSVRVWDLATGAPVGAPFTGHDGPVWAVAVAEVAGRPVVVSGSGDESVRVWDLATGAPVGAPFTGHDRPVWAVAVAEVEGRPVVVSGSDDRSVRVWDLATGAPVGAPFTGHDAPVRAVAVAEVEGRPVVVSGSDDRSVRVWDLATGAPVGAPLTGHDGPVRAVAVAEVAGRPVVVSGSDDRSVRVWDLATGAPVGAPFTGHDRRVWAVAVAEVAGRPVVVSGSDDRSVRVWDLATGAPVGAPFTGHDAPVVAVAVAEVAGRPVVVSGSGDRSVRVWDLATGAPVGAPFTGHDGPVWAVAVAEVAGRPVVVSGSGDESVRVWDLATGAPVGAPLTGHDGPVWAVAVAEVEGRPVVVSGSGDRSVRVWDLATGAPVGAPLTGHDAPVWAVAVAEVEGRPVVVSGSGDRSVRVWDLATGAPVGAPLTGHDGPVWAVAVAEVAGRPVVVSGSDDRSVRVWDLATGAPVGAPFTGHDAPVWAVAVAEVAGRPVVVSGSGDRSVRVWDLATGAPVGAPFTGHDGPVVAVAVAEVAGRPVVVSGSDDRSVRVWDLATGAPVGAPFTGHDGPVWAVAVAEVAGRPVVVSGSDDRSVRVWDLATGAPVGAPFTGHDAPVVAVAVAEVEGRPVVVSGSDDRSVRVWDLATGAPVGAPLTGHDGPVWAVAVAEVDGRSVVTVASGHHLVLVTLAGAGSLEAERLIAMPSPLNTLAAAGRALICGADQGIVVIDF
jgi:WD40 repeat protein